MSRWVLWVVLGTTGCKDREPAPAETETGIPEAGERSVVVLVMDGVRVDESLGDGESSAAGVPSSDIMPGLRELVSQEGALVSHTYVTGLTMTGPGHVDMLVGRHLPFANYPVDADGVTGAYLPELPTLFEALSPEAVQLVGNGNLIAPAARSLYTGSDHPGAPLTFFGRSDPALLLELRNILTLSRPRLIVVNLHDIDRSGHSGEVGASGEPLYVEQARALDDELLLFWSWLQDEPELRDSTTVVITSDHGRHRLGNDGDWIEHGDQCTGCREIPLALLGSGIEPGVVVDTPQSLLDLNQTIAALLGVPAPYSQGTTIPGVLTEGIAATGAAAGALHPVAADDLVVFQENLQGDGARSQIVDSNGTVLSSAEAWMAEDPTMVSHSGQLYAVWRELGQASTESKFMFWTPAAATWDGSQWSSMPLPIVTVSSYWKPALLSSGKQLWLLSIDNPNGMTINGVDPIDVVVLRLSGATGEWLSHGSLLSEDALSFPSSISAHVALPMVYYALSSADPRSKGRFTRRIEVHSAPIATLETERIFTVGPQATTGVSLDATVPAARLERPALWGSGDDLHLAMLAYQTEAPRAALLLTSSSDGGASWSTPAVVSTGPVLGHIAPRWTAGGVLWWMELSDNTVSTCSLTDGVAARCSATDFAFAEGLSTSGERALFSARSDALSPWEIVTTP
jgi:hypothetical protein